MTPPPRARANTVGVHRWRTTLNKQRKLRKQLGSLLAGHSGFLDHYPSFSSTLPL